MVPPRYLGDLPPMALGSSSKAHRTANSHTLQYYGSAFLKVKTVQFSSFADREGQSCPPVHTPPDNCPDNDKMT